MDCHANMDFKNNEISSKDFFCTEKDGLEFYSEFPMMNAKYEYIIIDKTTGIKISDLNSVDKSKLSIQKNLVQ